MRRVNTVRDQPRFAWFGCSASSRTKRAREARTEFLFLSTQVPHDRGRGLIMAIPFCLPNNGEERTPEEQLMIQVYVQLQNALRSRNAHHPSRNRELHDLLSFFALFVDFDYAWKLSYCYLLWTIRRIVRERKRKLLTDWLVTCVKTATVRTVLLRATHSSKIVQIRFMYRKIVTVSQTWRL